MLKDTSHTKVFWSPQFEDHKGVVKPNSLRIAGFNCSSDQSKRQKSSLK